jgi:hypothetical protein
MTVFLPILISLLILVPLCGFLISLLFRNSRERTLSTVALYTTGASLLFTVTAVVIWLSGD